LDSGVSVSTISGELYQNLTSDPTQDKIPLFSLNGILLTTSFNNKSVKIKSQIYLNFSIQNYETFGIFLIVPHLFVPLILGTDWLMENGMTIDCNAKEISLPSLNDKIPFKLIIDHDPNSLVNSLKNINISEDFPLLSESPSNLMYNPPPFETEKNIALDDFLFNISQQNLMTSLLQNFQNIFKTNPAFINSFLINVMLSLTTPTK